MTLYKTVIIPQLTYACHAIYGEEPKGQKNDQKWTLSMIKNITECKRKC